MHFPHWRFWGLAPRFDPREGITVLEPEQPGPGWWAGACSALFDPPSRTFYLYYRRRKPRELGRGTDCYIAVSDDGVHFETLWHLSKDALGSPSIEKGCLARTLDGHWRLYISYVDPADHRWRTDVLEAEAPDRFDPERRWKVFTAEDVGVEGVKDPYLISVGGLYYLFLSYARSIPVPPEREAEKHATGDIYSTGLTLSATALAISHDGLHFEWQGEVLGPVAGRWDAYCARISSLLYTPPVFTAFYDGSRSVEENYEEKLGLAISFDLRHFQRLSVEGPFLVSPHGSGSLRYLEALAVEGEVFYYYEYARPDGSHELRLNRAPLPP